MYEVTLSVDKTNQSFLDYVDSSLQSAVSGVGALRATCSTKRRSYLSLACSDAFSKPFCDSVADAVAEVLGVGYKNLFIRKKLAANRRDFYFNTLVNAMCLFDSGYDRKLIRRMVKAEGEVCIDGYYNFRMTEIKRKWEEVASLVSGSRVIMEDSALLKEFLAYLLEAVPSSASKVSVTFDGGKAQLFDSSNRLINSGETVFPATAEEKALMGIFCVKPKKVTVYCNKSTLQKGFLDLCCFLFDTKVIENS